MERHDFEEVVAVAVVGETVTEVPKGKLCISSRLGVSMPPNPLSLISVEEVL